MGSAGIPYLSPVQRTYPSTTEFFPIFVCLFTYLYAFTQSYMAVPGHL